MTAAGQEVEVRWLPGRGSCPGALDLTVMGPGGPTAKAFGLPEAIAAIVLIDAFCSGSHLLEAVRQAAECASMFDDQEPREERPVAGQPGGGRASRHGRTQVMLDELPTLLRDES